MYGTDGAHPSEGESWARFAAEGPALSVRGKRVLRFKFISFKSRCVTERPALSVWGFFQVSSFTSPVFLLGDKGQKKGSGINS